MSSEDSRLAPAVSQPILVDLAKFRARAAAWAVGAHQAAVQDTPAAAPLPPSIRPSPTPIHASATAPPHLLADHIRSGAFELTVAAPPPAPPAGADASPDADASPPLTASPHAPPPPNATSPPLTSLSPSPSPSSLSGTVMEHPQAYDTQDHDIMQEDTARMRAFAVAIERAVPGRVVLDMGAGPDAVLALCAARCGAARVYAVEGNASAAAAAARLVRRKEETGELRRGVVRVVARVSTDLNFADVPAGTVEVLVHELMGILASSEGVRHFVRGLRPFLAPGCVSIPASACTLVAPGMLPPLELLSAPSIR